MTISPFNIKEKVQTAAILPWLALVISLIDRVHLLFNFQFDIADIDQMILWHGVKDYAAGIFHEPFFYGQDYNLMVEAFLAVPLIWLGIKPQVALPIITLLLSLLPFILFGIFFLRQQNLIAATLLFAWPAFMPIEYTMIASMPRGFVSGIAVASLASFCLQNPSSIWSNVWLAIVAPVSLWICPNSSILLAFIVPYLWTKNWKRWQFYVLPSVMLILVFILNTAAKNFYEQSQEWRVHSPWNAYKGVWIIGAFKSMEIDAMHKYLMPLLSTHGIAVLPALIMLAIIAVRKNKPVALGLTFCVLACLAALGHSRIYSGLDHVFFSYTRNWLSVPIVMALSVGLLINKNLGRVWLLSAIILAASANMLLKSNQLQTIKVDLLQDGINRIVPYNSLSSIESRCNLIDSVADRHAADIVLFVPGHINSERVSQYYHLGCPILTSNFPPSTISKGDRLTWNFGDLGNQQHEKILVYGGVQLDWIPEGVEKEHLHSDPMMILISNYDGTLFDLIEAMDLDRNKKRIEGLRKKPDMVSP